MSKHLRHILIPSLILGAALPVFSATVEVDEARTLAAEFMNARGKSVQADAALQPAFKGGSEASPLYYVFNFPDGGFVIVSGEDSTNPVLGYSLTGSYDVASLPGAMKWMMAGLERELKAAPQLQSGITSGERRRMARVAASAAEEHLLPTAKWSQEAPFNSMIPGRPLVGCVGTAMATIMKYHQWPAAGTGSFGGVDFGEAYDWSSMRTDNYRSGYTATEGEAVALLMYHASKSIDTQYAMSGSSAYEVRVPGALSSYFGYDPGVSYKKRADVATQEAWDAIVKAEIDAGRPVLYCGQDVSAGHAFVCDGYQGEYLHFNWGWGGSADGYFLSTALNPTVSRTHQYNNLNTIIYNIKPASGEVKEWSPVRITADGNQVGMGSNLIDLASGQTFKVRVGNLKNVTYTDFKGKIAVALCSESGAMKALLCTPSAFSLKSMEYLFDGYRNFNSCALPAGTSVAAGDVVRMVTQADGSSEWLPVAGELLTLNELQPAPGTPSSFRIDLPSQAGATVEGEPSVIRGWDYSFKVVPANASEDILTVKANGNVLTPGNNNTYTIGNVREDQVVTLLVQKASEVLEKRSVWVETPGTLSAVLGEDAAAAVKDLTVFGSIDVRDFEYIKSATRLTRLDLSGAYISANGSNQANAIPRDAFRGIGSLEEVVLPNSVNRLNNGCFRQCGIKTITIPAGVKTYEYNVFVAASRLRDIWVQRESAEFINWCVLSGVKVDEVTLHVPNDRAWTNYNKAENWNTIKNIVVEPVQAADDALFAVMESKDVKFECETPAGRLPKGTQVKFKASHIADNDNRMEVYANAARLTPDADGYYTANVGSNTIVHFNMVAPINTEANGKSQWTLTGKNGSVGLLTDAVNVIRGQEFTIRVNALNIPQYMDQFFWAAALTDSKGNIKEFISPAVLWNAGSGDDFKMNVNCLVSETDVREGNQIRLVTSANNKKTWQVVKGAGEGIVDALPALNNMTPLHNIRLNVSKGTAKISGIPESGQAVHGMDLAIKVTPDNAAYRINMTVNDKPVASNATSVNYTLVAKEDADIDIAVFDPKAEGEVTYLVDAFSEKDENSLFQQMTNDNVQASVIIKGITTSGDLVMSFKQQEFALKTVKKLDLSGLTIRGNILPSNMFYNDTKKIIPVLEEIILPNSVTMIEEGAFRMCDKLKEITLPESLTSAKVEVTTASGGKKSVYAIGKKIFDGCTALTTIRIPGDLATVSGKQVVCHFNPIGTMIRDAQYGHYYEDQPEMQSLGHVDPTKVTVVVPEKYLNVYRTPYTNSSNGNPWEFYGYNILCEDPVYGVNFDPSRVQAAADVDVSTIASFLGDNVPLESIKTGDKLRLTHPEIKCLVFDNGKQIEPNADGTIDIEFLNPAKNSEGVGNHNIDVVYTYDVNFTAQSDLFNISEPEVTNEKFQTASFDTEKALEPVLKNVPENSAVRFRVGFTSEHQKGLELRVMSGIEELMADAEGYYNIDVTNAGREIAIFTVPTDGALINAEELASINPEEAHAVTSIALGGEMSAEDLAHAVECFPALESLDLSLLEGDIPDGFLNGMETLETVVLPQIETIPENMFSGCTNLTSVEIPASVNVIGEGAFKDCASLETLRLTGVDQIGAGAFSGCDNLTSITLLEDVAGQAASGEARRRVRAAGIDSRAFEGLNPNCIILLDEGVAAPAAAANYLHTSMATVTETLPDGSEIEREGRVYSAHSPLTFVDTHPLAFPHAFTLADGATVSLESEREGWKDLVVPFDVEKITDASGNELNFGAREADAPRLYKLNENAEGLETAVSMAAHEPFLLHTEGKVTFTKSAGHVETLPAEIRVNGTDYSLHTTYTAKDLPAEEVYLLNSNASAFEPAGAEGESVRVAPFRVYATSPESVGYILTNLPGADYETGVEGREIAEGLRVYRDGSNLVIISDSERVEKLFDVDGRLLRVLHLSEGRNDVELPGTGIYFVGKSKILF